MCDMAEGGAPAQPQVQYVQTGIHLNIERFSIPEDRQNAGIVWEEWLEEFEEEAKLQKVTEVEDWCTCLRRYGGPDVRKLAKHLPDPPPLQPAPEQGESDYDKLKRKLNLHFIPKKNKQHARYLFSKEKPQTGEPIVSYTARLRVSIGYRYSGV